MFNPLTSCTLRFLGNPLQHITGKGIGSIVTGYLFDGATGIGPVWTFRVCGTFALTLFILYSLLCFLVLRGKDAPKKRKPDDSMTMTNSPGRHTSLCKTLVLGSVFVNCTVSSLLLLVRLVVQFDVFCFILILILIYNIVVQP